MRNLLVQEPRRWQSSISRIPQLVGEFRLQDFGLLGFFCLGPKTLNPKPYTVGLGEGSGFRARASFVRKSYSTQTLANTTFQISQAWQPEPRAQGVGFRVLGFRVGGLGWPEPAKVASKPCCTEALVLHQLVANAGSVAVIESSLNPEPFATPRPCSSLNPNPFKA